jgi:hypothetical protein
MEIVTKTSTEQNDSNDATHVARERRNDVAPRRPETTPSPSLDADTSDPYDNIACTD